MRRETLGDLNAFVAVAEEKSFTRAAARLGTSQSAISYAIQRLETRLGVRLLIRTTRSVAPSAAGDRLLATLGPALDSIEAQLGAIGELRERPSGLIRITAAEHAAENLLWPVLDRWLPLYPDIQVELSIDSHLVDLAEGRFDAGIRIGEGIAKDMVATRIGPDLRMVVVGAPSYFSQHPLPLRPQDLAVHRCINQRQMSAGSLYAWELEKDGQEIRVRVDGALIFNSTRMIIKAALAGHGLACVMEDRVRDDLAAGRLIAVLDDWCQPFAGYHLYYPSRRQHSAAFALLLDALRYRPVFEGGVSGIP